MRKMKFKPEYLKLLKMGKKRSTIRLEKKYREGEVIYLADTSGRIYGKARISRIIEKPLNELDDVDALIDGFEDLQELKNALSDIYGEISDKQIIYIYYLDIIGWWREPT